MGTAGRKMVESLGARAMGLVSYAGGLSMLFFFMFRAMFFCFSSFKTFVSSLHLLAIQMVRVGVKSTGIVVLIQVFIGVILALQMAPPLKNFGQEATIANIIGVSGFRMLGPIITAVVLTGFAGASIAAEIGTMVVAEEIEAMEAMAISPMRFLVVPRVIASFIMTILLAVIADIMIAVGGYITAHLVLGSDVYGTYWDRMRDQLKYADFITGLVQAGVFGLLISIIACYEGLKVKGGAEGVGRATTMTVVYSIVAIIASACLFTVLFYVYEL